MNTVAGTVEFSVLKDKDEWKMMTKRRYKLEKIQVVEYVVCAVACDFIRYSHVIDVLRFVFVDLTKLHHFM